MKHLPTTLLQQKWCDQPSFLVWHVRGSTVRLSKCLVTSVRYRKRNSSHNTEHAEGAPCSWAASDSAVDVRPHRRHSPATEHYSLILVELALDRGHGDIPLDMSYSNAHGRLVVFVPELDLPCELRGGVRNIQFTWRVRAGLKYPR